MAKKSGTFGRTAGYVLLGLLLVGLGGFGATNFGGTVREIGTVGEASIPATDYFRALQNEIRAVESETGEALPFQEARARGITDRVLSQVIVTAALEHEAARLGISVGDARLAEELRNLPAFQGVDGSFNREGYRLALDNAGFSEREFEEQLRAESASTLLQGAVLAGVRLPDTYIDTLIAFTGERRSFTWAEVGSGGLSTGLPAPSEADLQAWYDDNIGDYTRPVTKVITYVWLTPDMILDTVEVDEATMRAAYEEREAEFNLPERRLVERLVFADQAAADAALSRITAGEARFEDLVAERDLDLSDTDLGDVTRSDLEGAADAVFAASSGDVVTGPSSLGPALFRVNAVLAAQETSFEEAQPELRDALALDRARRVIDAQAQGYDDELAAGLTLDELAAATELKIGQIDWTGAEAEGIAGYAAFRSAAADLGAGDYPAIDQLGDGGVFAMRLDEVQEAAPYPFEDVRETVVTDWEANAREDALEAEAEALAQRLSEGTTFEGLGLDAQSQQSLSRTSFGAQLPPGALQAVFALDSAGETTTLRADGQVWLVQLDAIEAADPEDETAAQFGQLFGDQAAQGVAQDLFRALATDIQARAGVNIDQAAVNAVHANFQ